MNTKTPNNNTSQWNVLRKKTLRNNPKTIPNLQARAKYSSGILKQ